MSTEGSIQALSPEQQLTKLEQLDLTHQKKEKGLARFLGKEVKVALCTSLPFVLAGLMTLLTSFFLPLGLAFGLATAGYFAAGTIASAAIFSKSLSDRKAEATPAESVFPYMNQNILTSIADNAPGTGSSKQIYRTPVVNKAQKEPSKPLLSGQGPDSSAASGHKALSGQSLNPASGDATSDNPDSRPNTDNSIENPDPIGKTPVTPDASKDNTEHSAENTSTQNTETHASENAGPDISLQRRKEKALANKLTNGLFISLSNRNEANSTAATSLEGLDSAFGDEVSPTQSDQRFSADYNSTLPANSPCPSEPKDDSYAASSDSSVNPSATGSIPLQRDQEQPATTDSPDLSSDRESGVAGVSAVPAEEPLINPGSKSYQTGASTSLKQFQNEITPGQSKRPATKKTQPESITRKSFHLSGFTSKAKPHENTKPRKNEELTIQKQPENKMAPGIEGKAEKVPFPGTDTHTISTSYTSYKSAEKIVASSVSSSLTGLSEKSVAEGTTSLVRASAKPVGTTYGNDTTGSRPSVEGKALYFKVKLTNSDNHLHLQLTPENTDSLISDNTGLCSTWQPDLLLKIEEESATTGDPGSALAMSANPHGNFTVTILVNQSSASTAITFNRLVTLDDITALNNQLAKFGTCNLDIDKSKYPALQLNKLLALESGSAFGDLEDITDTDKTKALISEQSTDMMSLSVSGHPISVGQQAASDRQPQSSRTEEIAHGMFGDLKVKRGNSRIMRVHTTESELPDPNVLYITESPEKRLRTFLPVTPELPIRISAPEKRGLLAGKAIPTVPVSCGMKPAEPMISQGQPLPPTMESQYSTEIVGDDTMGNFEITDPLRNSAPQTPDDKTTLPLKKNRTGASQKTQQRPSTDPSKTGLFDRAKNQLSETFSDILNTPDRKKDGTVQKKSEPEDIPLEEIVNETILKKSYADSALLSSKDALIKGVSKHKVTQECITNEKEFPSKPEPTDQKLKNQLARDAKGLFLDVRLQQSDGAISQISHRNLSDFTDPSDDKAHQLVAKLYDEADDFLVSGGVQDESRRHHLRDTMLNFSHQGAFAIHYSIGSVIADTYIESLKSQLGQNTDLVRLYKSDELIDIGCTSAEQNAAYTINPASTGRLAYVEFQIDKDNQNLTIKKIYECPLPLIKHSDNTSVSDSAKRVSIEVHCKLDLLSDTQNKVELITATEISANEGQSDQQVVVLLDNQHTSKDETLDNSTINSLHEESDNTVRTDSPLDNNALTVTKDKEIASATESNVLARLNYIHSSGMEKETSDEVRTEMKEYITAIQHHFPKEQYSLERPPSEKLRTKMYSHLVALSAHFLIKQTEKTKSQSEQKNHSKENKAILGMKAELLRQAQEALKKPSDDFINSQVAGFLDYGLMTKENKKFVFEVCLNLQVVSLKDLERSTTQLLEKNNKYLSEILKFDQDSYEYKELSSKLETTTQELHKKQSTHEQLKAMENAGMKSQKDFFDDCYSTITKNLQYKIYEDVSSYLARGSYQDEIKNIKSKQLTATKSNKIVTLSERVLQKCKTILKTKANEHANETSRLKANEKQGIDKADVEKARLVVLNNAIKKIIENEIRQQLCDMGCAVDVVDTLFRN